MIPAWSWKQQSALMNTFLPTVMFLPYSVWNGGNSPKDGSTDFSMILENRSTISSWVW